MQEYDKAIKNLDKAIEINPDNSLAYNNLGFIYSEQKDFENAISKYKIAIEKGNTIAYNNLGTIYLSQERYKEAEDSYKKALISFKDNSMILYNLGIFYFEQEQYDEAIKFYEKSLEIQDDEATRFHLGLVFSLTNQYEKAKNNYEKVTKNPRFSFPYLNEIYLQMIKNIKELDSEILVRIILMMYFTDEILKRCHIKIDNIAHYTSINVFSKILEGKKNEEDEKIKEKFLRMGISHLCNDPTEGHLLYNYLELPIERLIEQYLCFLTCFSLDTDSLNQFRLYGKENGREATGVAIVLNSSFFSKDFNNLDYFCEKSSSKIKFEETNKIIKTEHRSLYRCIYFGFDNKNKERIYCKLAKRSEWSEFNEIHKSQEDYDNLEKLEKEIENSIKKIMEHNNMLVETKMTKVTNLIPEILMPLRYLIKDPAYEEERECRIIKILKFGNEEIIEDNELKRIYSEYKVNIEDHIAYINIHQRQELYTTFFQNKLKDRNKVKISKNPFNG